MTRMAKMILLVKIQSLEGQIAALRDHVVRLSEDRDQLIRSKMALEGEILLQRRQLDIKGLDNQKMVDAICHARDYMQHADRALRVATGYSL